jgi:hypothetical protein
VTPNGNHPFYCEVEGCDEHAERVEGSPVYHYVCRPHAEQLGLHVLEDHVPAIAPRRALPIAVFDGYSEAQGRPVRVAPLESLIVALEEALVADEPLEQLRQLVRGMRLAVYAEPDEIPSVIAPGF